MRRIKSIEREAADPVGSVELRVHGVSGTPPEEMLGTHEVVQVRGDEHAGFFRPKAAATDVPVDALEAYSWGGLTSRSWTRALWVLLAPFALLNVAGWMLPAAPDGRVKRVAEGALRLLGLHLTVMVTMWIGQVTMEFVAFQCGGVPSCRQQLSLLDVIFRGSWLVDAPGRRLVIGAAGPLLFVLVLLRLSRVSTRRYEGHDPFTNDGPQASASASPNTFADPTFWQREAAIRRFASLHLAGALATVAYQLSVSTRSLLADAEDLGAFVLGATAWVTLVLGVVIAVEVARYDVAADRGAAAAGDRRRVPLPVAAWSLVLVAVVFAWTWPGDDPLSLGVVPVPLERYGTSARWSAIIGLAIAIGFLVALGVLWWGRKGRVRSPLVDADLRLGFFGWSAAFAAILGYGIAGVLLVSTGSGVARYLGGRPTIARPAAYDASALVTVALLILLVVGLLLIWRFDRRLPSSVDDAVLFPPWIEEEGDVPVRDVKAPLAWTNSVRRARRLRAFVLHTDQALAFILGGAALVLIALSISARVSAAILDRPWPWVDTAALWIVGVGIPLGMILLVRRAFVSTTARRRVGVLWDVLTFWPRWYHPLAPPSYSTRAVPELQTRLRVLTGEGSNVIASAHSQGSVIALAAVHGLVDAEDEASRVAAGRVAMLTYGSPITRLYLRHFPAHLRASIERVHEAMNAATGRPRWLNLYRATDPIGGAIIGESDPATAAPIACDLPDWFPTDADRRTAVVSNPILDPDVRGIRGRRPPGPLPGDQFPRASTHFRYEAAPEYEEARLRLQASLAAPRERSTEPQRQG